MKKMDHLVALILGFFKGYCCIGITESKKNSELFDPFRMTKLGRLLNKRMAENLRIRLISYFLAALFLTPTITFAADSCTVTVPADLQPVAISHAEILADPDYWGYPGGGPFYYADGYDWMDRAVEDALSAYHPPFNYYGASTSLGPTFNTNPIYLYLAIGSDSFRKYSPTLDPVRTGYTRTSDQNNVPVDMKCPDGFTADASVWPPVCNGPCGYYIAYSGSTPQDNGPSCPSVKDPINPTIGNHFQRESIRIRAGESGLDLNLFYNSNSVRKGMLGSNWSYQYSGALNFSTESPTSFSPSVQKSSEYTTETDACLQGWFEIQSSLTEPWAAGATANLSADHQCLILDGNRTVLTLPIYKTGDIVYSPNEPVITALRPDGREISFKQINSVWQNESNGPEILKDLVDASNLLTGYQFTDKNNDVEVYDTSGKLLSISNVHGNSQTLAYDSITGLLASVTASDGFSIDFNYDASQRISTVTDTSNRVWGFRYDANNNLEYVDNPDLTTRQYHYADARFPNALTSISDERGMRYTTWEYDDQGRAFTNYLGPQTSVLSDRIDGVSITYNTDGTRIVTDSRGNASSYSTTLQLGKHHVTSISGPGCSSCGASNVSYMYDTVTNNLLSKTENGVTTQYGNYDAKREYAYKIEAVGTSEERRTDYTYDSRYFNKIATKTEPSVFPGASKVTTYTYDDFGNRTSETIDGFKPDGTPVTRSITYQYNGPLHQLTQVDGPRSDVSDITTLDYYPNDPFEGNNRGRLQRVTAPGNIVLRDNIQYTAAGKVLSEDRPNGVSISYSYYPGNDRLDTMTETSGGMSRSTHWTYLATGEVASITQGYGSTEATSIFLSYDDARRLTRLTDGLGNYLDYTLDTEGNVTGENTYDTSGLLQKTLGRTFDVYNRLDKLAQPNQLLDYNYNPDGTLASMVDGNNQTTTYQYDSLKRLTSTQEIGGEATQYEYNQQDTLTTVTDPNTNATQYIVDDLGNQIQRNSPDTGITSYSYDSAGNVISKTDADGNTETYQYDALNRLISIDRAGTDYDAIYSYDSCVNGVGHLCTETNGLGEPVSYTYTPLGQVASITSTQGSVNYNYDTLGRVASITYPSGGIVRYSYDAAGQVDNVSLDDNGNITSLVSNILYKPFGPASQLTFGNGLVDNATYDQQYWLRYTSLAGTAGSIWSRDYASYDGNGNLLQVNTNGALSIYNYDTLDRLTSANDPSFGNQIFSYDLVGNRTLLTDNGTDTVYGYETGSNRQATEGVWSYTRDAAGNTLSKLDANGAGYTYTYTASHRLATVNKVIYTPGKGKGKNSTPTLTETLLANYAYNSLGQRVSKTVSGVQTGFIYGLDGNLLAEIASDGSVQTEYIYLNGQPIAMRTASSSAPPPASGTEVIVNNGDSNTLATGTWTADSSKKAYLGDDLIAGGDTGSTYRWTPSLSGGTYDVYAWWVASKKNNNPAAQYRIVHNGVADIVSADQTSSGGKWVLLGNYTFSGDGSEYIELSDAGGRVIADAVRLVQTNAAPAPNSTSMTLDYIYTDRLGTPRRATDSNGAVVWSWDSDAFGTAADNDDPDGDGVATVINLRFPGQYYDAETGLHYNYFRYYDPSTGRYITSDPIGLIAGLNTYGYVAGNPVNFSDPLGLLTRCERKWLIDNYGYPGLFITDTFNAQQYIPGLSDDLKGSLKTAAEVGAEKTLVVGGMSLAGRAIYNNAARLLLLRIGSGLITTAGLSSGVLEVAGAGLTPFATTALHLARLHCKDPITGKRCK
jgi:RHS repeat-associated protein